MCLGENECIGDLSCDPCTSTCGGNECVKNFECPTNGDFCQNGFCRTLLNTTGSACEEDKDCSVEQVCFSEVCQFD